MESDCFLSCAMKSAAASPSTGSPLALITLTGTSAAVQAACCAVALNARENKVEIRKKTRVRTRYLLLVGGKPIIDGEGDHSVIVSWQRRQYRAAGELGKLVSW